MDCRHLVLSHRSARLCTRVSKSSVSAGPEYCELGFVEGASLMNWLGGEKEGANPCRHTTKEVGVRGMEALCIQQLYECSPDEGNLHFTNCVCPCVRCGSGRFSIQCFCTEISAAVMQMSSCQCCKDRLKKPHVFKFKVFMKFSFCSA